MRLHCGCTVLVLGVSRWSGQISIRRAGTSGQWRITALSWPTYIMCIIRFDSIDILHLMSQ